jgi:hypothetical protein
VSHGVIEELCARCPFEQACKRDTAYWTDTLSLTEALQKAERAFEGERQTEDVARLYMDLCRKHYGRRFPPKAEEYLRKGRGADCLIKANAACAAEDLDIALWIEASMVGMFAYAKHSKWGFQPWMLVGDRARARYNIFIRKANRKRHVSVGAFDHKTKAALRERLALDESMVGSNYVAAYIADEPMTWKQASDMAEVSSEWVKKLGGRDLWRIIPLQAAVDVAASYDPRLPDLIGFTEFSWQELAVALSRIIDTPSQPELDLDDIPGVLYGTHRL